MTSSNTITLQIGGALELILRQPPPEIATTITVRYGNFTATARGQHMAYTLPVDMLIKVQVAYQDAHGNPAKVDGDVMWESSNPEITHIDVDQGDSTICTISATGQTGTSQVVAKADADIGEGIRELLTTLDVTVVAGEAVAGTINVVAEPQPIGPHVEHHK